MLIYDELLGFTPVNPPIGDLLAPFTYEFSATYDTVSTIGPPTQENPNVLRVNVTGEIAEGEVAPFGLTNFESNAFGTLASITTSPDGIVETARFIFDADPTKFGLPAALRQPYSDRYYGKQPGNELFGNASDSAEFNFVEGTIKGGGTITIIDGSGIFKNATGLITFAQQDLLPPIQDPTAPFESLTEPAKGQATLSFSINSLWPLPIGGFLPIEAPIGDYLALAG